MILDDGDLLFGLRINPGHHGATDHATCRQHALQLIEGGNRLNLGITLGNAGHFLPVPERLIGIERGVWHHPEDATLEFTIKAVHDGQNGDQHGHSQHQAEYGRERDEGDEMVTALRTCVTQADE